MNQLKNEGRRMPSAVSVKPWQGKNASRGSPLADIHTVLSRLSAYMFRQHNKNPLEPFKQNKDGARAH